MLAPAFIVIGCRYYFQKVPDTTELMTSKIIMLSPVRAAMPTTKLIIYSTEIIPH
jgi:hypothetical protein